MERSRLVKLMATVLWLLSAAGTARASGGLIFVEMQRDAIAGVDGLSGASSVAVSSDGAHVYVAGHEDDAVAVFRRDPVTGGLTLVEVQKEKVGNVDGLKGAASVTLSPDGEHVYVASDIDDAVAVFSRDATSGALSFVEVQKDGIGGVDGLDGASSVVVSPDGNDIYVAARNDDAVAVFGRDGTTGALSFVEMQKDGTGGVDGLNGSSAVTTSPDGRHVYVAGPLDDAVAVFARDAATGALSFIQAEHEGLGTAQTIESVRSVAVSPDGKNVYAANAVDGTVAVFKRDATTGELELIELQRDGVASVDGIKGAHAVAVSPDGQEVYVGGPADDSLALFSRNTTTGELRFVEKKTDQVAGVQGIGSVRAIATSPDGKHVYTADAIESALAVFAQDYCGNLLVSGDEQCDDGNTVSGDGCSSTCTLELCGPTPITDCLRPKVSQHEVFRMKKKTDPGHDELVWRWVLDKATDVAAFGSPLNTANYELCVYDASAAPQPLLSLAAPAGGTCGGQPCWQSEDVRGFRYTDKDLTPNGILSVLLRRERSGRARITVTGVGAKLGAKLPLSPTVTVQLQNTQTGFCWGAEYSTTAVNSSVQFRATGF